MRSRRGQNPQIPCFTLACWAALLAARSGVAVADESPWPPPDDAVPVQIIEGCKSRDWTSARGRPSLEYRLPACAMCGLPRKYSNKGLIADRSSVFLVRALAGRTLAGGEYRLLVRAVSGSRLLIDGQEAAATEFVTPNAEGHEHVPTPAATEAGLPELPVGHRERIVRMPLSAGRHQFQFEVLIGSDKLRQEIGAPCVAIAAPGGPFELLTADGGPRVPFTDSAWRAYRDAAAGRLARIDARNRRRAAAAEAGYWRMRHEMARAEIARRAPIAVPAAQAGLPAHNEIDAFLNARLAAAGRRPWPLAGVASFLRRVTLDALGTLPPPDDIPAFCAECRTDRLAARRRVIDRLLSGDRWADNWVGYWQDVLAENPGILKPELNNTGPFRWWIHESFLDNKPMDRFAAELITMEGSMYAGGPAGFAVASQNDAPLAEKADIIAQAFLGVELKCARCHDAPYHPFKQRDLFGLAAMLDNRPLRLPASSTVRVGPAGRQPLVKFSLKPGDAVAPQWPFGTLAPDRLPDGVLRNPNDFRERLAAIVTSPRNDRFARVLVNRLWKRYFGTGLVEPVDDWNEARPSQPELLDWLARELVSHDYDLKHVARLIFNSHAYQRAATDDEAGGPTLARLFAAPTRRRMSAEQIVDSLFAASGKPMNSEMLTMDPEVRRGVTAFLNLGSPTAAWQFTSLSNERDRPALALPAAQSFVDVLTTFGWRDSRSNPLSVRDEEPTVLQPLTLANGVLGNRIVRLSDDNALTALALRDQSVERLVDAIFLRFLSRPPSPAEAEPLVAALRPGYASRRRPAEAAPAPRRTARAGVSWSNHLSPEATRIKIELERVVREGDPPTRRLDPDWRERMEDVVWAVVNLPEFVFIP